jgi:chaperonin GroES
MLCGKQIILLPIFISRLANYFQKKRIKSRLSRIYKCVELSENYKQVEEMFMKIKPMNDRVIVRRVMEEQKTAGGIIIPDTAKEKPQEGEVVAIGPGKRDDKGNRIALEVKEGDRILFGKYSGTDIKFDGEEHVFMREDDILGILS